MIRIRHFFAVALLAPLTTFSLSPGQPPFQFGGLHTDLVFDDAVARVQQLGATCEVSQSRSGNGGVNANCTLLPCTIGTTVGVCEEKHTLPTKLAIAAQPVFTVSLAGPGESLPVERISFLFTGSVDAMARYLIEQFGPPTSDGTSSKQQSWSHAQRRSWTDGRYNLELINSPAMLILTGNPPAAGTGDR